LQPRPRSSCAPFPSTARRNWGPLPASALPFSGAPPLSLRSRLVADAALVLRPNLWVSWNMNRLMRHSTLAILESTELTQTPCILHPDPAFASARLFAITISRFSNGTGDARAATS
jgi:hypothetical protein